MSSCCSHFKDSFMFKQSFIFTSYSFCCSCPFSSLLRISRTSSISFCFCMKYSLISLTSVSSPPRTSHSESGNSHRQGGCPRPAGFRYHRTSRRQTPTSAHARCRAGNGEERGGPYALKPRHAPALEPPASRTASAPPRSGAHGLVAAKNIPQRKLCGPSPRQGGRPRPAGVPSSRNLEAPDAHQRARML